ncbi:hypothetical protein MRX96_042211 [Rhipicephalus microplus]
MNAGENGSESSLDGTDTEQAASSSPETSSAETSRDSWVVSSEGEEQKVPEHETGEEFAELLVDEAHFPPLDVGSAPPRDTGITPRVGSDHLRTPNPLQPVVDSSPADTTSPAGPANEADKALPTNPTQPARGRSDHSRSRSPRAQTSQKTRTVPPREPAALEGPPFPSSHGATLYLGPPGSSALLSSKESPAIEGASGHLPTRPVVNACWRHPRAPVLVTTSPTSSSEPTSRDIKPRGREHLPTRRSRPASATRHPPGAVTVYKPFFACRSRSGRQCPLVTSTDPGHRDHFAAVVVVVRALLPGHPSTRSCHLEKSLPGQAYPPPPASHLPCPSSRSSGVPVVVGGVPLPLGGLAPRRRHWPSGLVLAPPASTGISAAASGPPRSQPPVVHQGIMTVYLPVPGMLRCSYTCCTGCQARTSVSLRLSAWRSHMKQKQGVWPTRRLYRCVACDALLNSLSARHDCPGPATNEPFHPCQYCPRYFN